MKKLRELAFILMALSVVTLQSCGGDDSDDNGRIGDNGTGIENTGGNGSTKLSPDKEKEFLEETSRVFLSYFDATEFDEVSNVLKQMGDLDGDVFDEWLDDAMEDSLTYSYSGYYAYEMYDALIRASNLKGAYKGSYTSGTWVRANTMGDEFTLTYTDRNNAVWVLTIAHSDDVKGRLYTGEYGRYSGTKDQYYDITVEVPAKVTATLTRQGETKAMAEINVDNMSVVDGQPSVVSTINGRGKFSLLTYSSSTDFSYAPNKGSSVSFSLQKGSTTLLDCSISGTPRINVHEEEIIGGKNITVKIDILGRVQIHASCSDTQSYSDAIDRADENEEDADIVTECANHANSVLTAYITNNNGSQQQAELKLSRTSEEDYGDTYYSLTPTLNFSDGTSYAFEEYFTERYFQSVIDTFNKIIDDFEGLAD